MFYSVPKARLSLAESFMRINNNLSLSILPIFKLYLKTLKESHFFVLIHVLLIHSNIAFPMDYKYASTTSQKITQKRLCITCIHPQHHKRLHKKDYVLHVHIQKKLQKRETTLDKKRTKDFTIINQLIMIVESFGLTPRDAKSLKNEILSVKGWIQAVASSVRSKFHLVATCGMGAPSFKKSLTK